MSLKKTKNILIFKPWRHGLTKCFFLIRVSNHTHQPLVNARFEILDCILHLVNILCQWTVVSMSFRGEKGQKRNFSIFSSLHKDAFI